MATFGIYQVLDPLYVTPRGSLCSGKIVGGDAEGRIAVKIFNPPPPEPDEPNWEPKYFLDRAQVQRRVAAAGGGHWAPVYALGFTPEGGAYYVTDYHALTAQKMVEGHVPLDAIALHAIVSSVVAGLEEIRRIAGRAHANLKPSNVLLIGKGPAEELRAVLSDPGQDYTAQKDGEAGDLHAIGALIHELVLHRSPADAQTPPAGEPAWDRLGDKAEGWRQLCGDLLAHPIPSRVATLDAVSKAVAALAPSRLRVPHLRLPGRSGGKPGAAPSAKAAKTAIKRPRAPRPPSRFKRRLLQMFAVLLLVGGGLGVLSMLEASARQELCAAREGWYGALAASLQEPARRERFAADPHLRRVAETVAEVEGAGIACDNGRPYPLGFLNFRKTRAAVDAFKRVEKDLAPESWAQLTPLRELAKTYEKRGWQQPAQFVTQLLEAVRPTPIVSSALSRPSPVSSETSAAVSATFPQRIDRVLRLRPIIEEQAKQWDANWKKLDEQATLLEQMNDPIVRGFGTLLRREAVSAVRLGDDGFEGATQLEQNAGLAGQVLDQLKTTEPAKLDRTRFADEVLARMNAGDLEAADVQTWLAERPLYVVKQAEIATAAEILQKNYDNTSGEVAKSAPEPAEAAAFEQELKDVEGALREFRQSPFIERDLTEGKLAAQVKQIQGQIDNLKRYYHAEDAADWLKNLAGVATNSDRLKSFWEAWVGTVRGEIESMATDRALFARTKSRTDKLRDVLTEIEITTPQPPTDLPADFAAVARQRREERLDELVSAIDLTDPVIKPEALKQSTESLAAWYANLKTLSEDFPVKTFLTLDDRPDKRWLENEAFWKDPLVQKLVRADVDRINRLQKLRTASRDELLKTAAADGVRPEVVVAAWQQLGDQRISPDWPGTAAELAAESALRTKVAAAITAVDEAERKPLAEQLAGEGPRRWRRFVERADAEPLIAAAVKQLPDFGINGFLLAEMNATARFNIWLYIANDAIRKNDVANLNNVVENLGIAANELAEQRKEAAELALRLDKLKVPDPFADQNLADRFGLRVPGLTDEIQFQRVEPSDGSRPFYLGTKEITLAQFVGVFDGMKQWDEARKLAWPYRPGKGDGRRGPRVWEWVEPAAPRFGPAGYWMTTDQTNKHNDFPRAFHPKNKFNINVIDSEFGGMPSGRHPMQYVSAHAALFFANALGCRLPTSAEWTATLAQSGKTPAKGDWNLRDQSWETFRKHAAENGIQPEYWPDRGAFPGETSALTAVPGPSRSGDDKTLLFHPVPTTNDGTFHDLIGNVAEFICERPDEFARWTDKSKAADVKSFLDDTPDAMFVIGGSALSPAGAALDKPMAVTRTDKGFSDVGIRLAFTAPARNFAERLKWVLASPDYVWPRTASADSGVR